MANCRSILSRRGAQWDLPGPVNRAAVRGLAERIADHLGRAQEVWRASDRDSDQLFHLLDERVVVTDLDGTFVSAWKATPEQLSHYRTGIRIR